MPGVTSRQLASEAEAEREILTTCIAQLVARPKADPEPDGDGEFEPVATPPPEGTSFKTIAIAFGSGIAATLLWKWKRS